SDLLDQVHSLTSSLPIRSDHWRRVDHKSLAKSCFVGIEYDSRTSNVWINGFDQESIDRVISEYKNVNLDAPSRYSKTNSPSNHHHSSKPTNSSAPSNKNTSQFGSSRPKFNSSLPKNQS